MIEQLVCQQGGEVIEAHTFHDGTTWDAQLLAINARRKFGKQLCIKCYRQANKDLRAQEGKGRRGALELLTEVMDMVSALEAIELASGEPHTAEVLRKILARLTVMSLESRERRSGAVPSEHRPALSYIEGESDANLPGDTSPEAPSGNSG